MFGAASPATAKGGDRAPAAPAPVAFECVQPATAPDAPVVAPDAAVVAPDAPVAAPDAPVTTPDTPVTTPDVAINAVGDAGCVAVLVTPGTVRLAWVVPAQGWSYEVRRNGGGTNDRVELRFTQAATNANLDFRFERGKTSIG